MGLEPLNGGSARRAALAEEVGRMLAARGETVALAESLTGGAVAALLTSVPGASRYVLGAVVAYQDFLKERWLKVDAALLGRRGAVSAEVAAAMAEGVRTSAGATFGVSTTGFAGPDGGTAAEPIGAVYCAVAGPSGCETFRHRFEGDRQAVRAAAVEAALSALRERLRAAGAGA